MTTGKKDQGSGEAKGFSGLSSLRSHIETSVPNQPPPTRPPEAAPTSSGGWKPETGETACGSHPQAGGPIFQGQTPSASPGKNWGVGIIVILGVIAIARFSQPHATNQSAPEVIPAPASAPPLAPTSTASRDDEQVPPVGTGRVLGYAEILYCKDEKIRLAGAEQMVDQKSDFDIDRFNAMVEDFNSRCGDFRYRGGALRSAQQTAETHRESLLEVGRGRFLKYRTR